MQRDGWRLKPRLSASGGKACLRRLQMGAKRASGGQRSGQPAQAGFVPDHREALQARLMQFYKIVGAVRGGARAVDAARRLAAEAAPKRLRRQSLPPQAADGRQTGVWWA